MVKKIRYTFKSPQGIQAEKIEYFDAQGNLDSTEHYQFSTDGFVSQFTDKFGRITQYTRDGFGRETKRVENVGTYQEKTTVISYSEGAQKPSLIDDGNTRWQMNYIWHATEQLITTRHQIDKATRDYRTTTYQYNANGQLTKIDGPRSDVDDSITYGYNAQGQKISVTNALGHQSKILSYNLQGLPTETVDANNIATTYQYDDMGRLTSQTKQGATTTISYDSNNNPLTLSGPNGSILNFHYDNANRLVAQTNEKGERVDFQLDASGNRIARTIKDKNGLLRFVENHQFDEFDRLQTIIDGNNASEVSSYLPGGLKSTNTDALGYITNYQYDSVAQLEQVTDANGGLTSYQYDQWGQTLSVTDAEGKTTSYQYNGFGELIEQHSPDTGTTQYSYDKAGNLSQTTHVESGKTISLKYDALNRIISDSARGVTYGYDQGVNGVGKLTSISDSNSTQQLSYDGNGNLVSDSYTIGGKTFTVTYQYNSASQLTGMTYPDGRTVEMTLNSSGQTTQLTTTDNGTSTVLASNIQYLPFGPMSSFDYGNGLSLSQTFDLNYNLSERNTSGIEALLYALSPRHEIESISDSLVSGNTQQFTYSPMQQLETAQGPYGQLSFSYDQIGNRLSRSNDTGTTQYSYQADSHRLKTLSGVENENFSYDARGQVIAKNNHSFSYDDAGRLSTFNNGSSVTSYQYNYRNLRSGKTSDGNTKHYIYNPAGMLLAEISSNGNVVVQYIYLNGQLLSVVYNSDYAGSPLPDLLYGYDDLSEYAYSQGQWSQSKSRNAFAGSHQTASGNSGSTFHWEPSLYDGVYEVYAQWIDNRKNAKQAVYRINHNNKTDTVLVNQSQNGGQLQLLGTFDFDGSPGEGVILSDENGKVSADLISVKRVADMPKESTLYLVHNDHLGTPTRLSNLNAEVVWKADYTPFGLAMVDEDADGNGSSITFNIRMPGQYFDSESNLHYNWYRYYDPSIGRYIQSDPIGLAGGINTYGYVSNNPMNFIDPMGLIERKLNKSEKRKLKIAVESIKCLGAEYEAKDLFSMIETNQIVIDTELMEKGAYGKAHEFFRGFSLAPELFEQNNAVIVGITAHEYAHVVEFNYAGSFAKLMLYPLAVFGIYDREKGPDVAETAILKKYFESDCQCDG